MTPKRPEWNNEAGAVAALFAVLIVVLLMMLAFILDLGFLRADRRAEQSTVDMAATAAIMAFNESDSPRAACIAAWTYFLINTPDADNTAPHPCAIFPEDPDSCDPLAPIANDPADGEVGPYRVVVTWPVSDNHALMTDHDRTANPDVDGVACDRVAVTVERSRDFVLAGAVFTDDDGNSQRSGRTSASAVARTAQNVGEQEIASLIVLEETSCDALTAINKGKVEVLRNTDDPDQPTRGLITVDSDGTTSCQTGQNVKYVIDAQNNDMTRIAAADEIFSYALRVGNTTHAYDPCDVLADTTCAGQDLVRPRPVPGRRVTRAPVDDRYQDAIRDFEAVIGIEPNAGKPPGFLTYPDDHIGGKCSVTNETIPEVPVGNWWVNCPTGNNLNIGQKGFVTFLGGTIVFQHSARIAGEGSLTIGTEQDDSRLFVRGGINRRGGKTVFERTVVYFQEDATMNLGGGDGEFRWTPPLSPGNPLRALALWSDSSDAHDLGGQATLSFEGVFFAPNADPFKFTGQSAQEGQRAQFIVRRLEVGGKGPNQNQQADDPVTLSLVPDPDLHIPVFVGEVRLIR